MSFGDKGLNDAFDRWATQTPEEYYGYDEVAICLECKKPFNCETDIQLCDKCMKLFNLDKLWKLHDKGKLDALDFNESSKLREKFRKKKRNRTLL